MEQACGITTISDGAAPQQSLPDPIRTPAVPAGARAALPGLNRTRCGDPTCGNCYQRPETD